MSLAVISADIYSSFRYQLWLFRKQRAEKDGLNSVQYKVLQREERSLYTRILVGVDEEKVRNTEYQ